jgi:hexosaminidase
MVEGGMNNDCIITKYLKMYLFVKIRLSLYLFLLMLSPVMGQGTVTDLRSMGYTIFPAPQQVYLEGGSIDIDESWQIKPDKSIPEKITNELINKAREWHGIEFSGTGAGQIELKISDDVVADIADPERSRQAYRITIGQDRVLIEGNAEPGLFYGTQSFLQVVKRVSDGRFKLPVGTITDWPDLELRVIHWDTKHHRDKMETLMRFIDWSAYFKINAIAFEIEDKYEYPSHPVIAHPNAFSKEEMHALTKYALDRYIVLIPDVQAPAHMGYVLKHKEFEHLRAEQESNYQACMCDEQAMELIFDMYQDMIDATPGVDYFLVSTDEIYYAGICGKCKDEYNDENRSQIWVDYLNRVNQWMNQRGRKVLAWVEYPLLPEDIHQLPDNIIDGIMDEHKKMEWINNENKAGIRQLSYNSMQGSEYLFPNYFPTTYRGRQIDGRLSETYGAVADLQARGADLIGTFAAAWDDAGLHNETFWLGWATVTQYGWTKSTPNLQQSVADFMDVFYGSDGPDMMEAYVLLEEGARFYEALWDRAPSKERVKGYGNSYGKGIGGDMIDMQLEMPALPSRKDLSMEPAFRSKYGQKIEEASQQLKNNDLLISKLMRNITRVSHNGYSLEVFLAIAFLERYTMETVLNLASVEDDLIAASKSDKDPAEAVRLMTDAYRLSGRIIKEQKSMWSDFEAAWYKSRLVKNQSVEGKDFYHEFDDVKDHFADRRKGLDYMLAPFERMEIQKWRQQLKSLITDFAGLHNIPLEEMETRRLED